MNIYDISQKAGVSIATVSRVLNGSEKVSEKTRKKVLAVMEENSYTPFSVPTPRTFTRHRQFIIWSGSFARIPMHPCSAAQGMSFWRNRAI